jgi:PII-like signaling protein
MLEKGPAKKVTVWVNEESRHHHEKLWLAIFDYLRHKRIAGASVTHTKMSFGARQHVHNADLPDTPELSYRIEFIETPERVEEVLPTLYEMVGDGLIEVQDTTVIKASSGNLPSAEQEIPVQRVRQKAQMMRIFLGEKDTWHGDHLYDAIVKRLRMMDIAGATVYRGLMGYGAKGETHRSKLLHISEDLPIMISVIDSAAKIDEVVPVVEGMIENGLIVLSEVDSIRVTRAKMPGEVPRVQR